LLINRIGDLGLLLGILLLYKCFRTVDFSIIFVCVPYFKDVTISFMGLSVNYLDSVCILLFVGVMGKSSQLGLHTWLPDAMEGPSPVSALIHAATLVTAGIFLIIRCSPIFEYAPNALFFITIIGSLTAFIAATIALLQEDVKKTIAYSTMSQLGYMSFICGLSSYDLSMFHLINHAFFKALLFLSAGAIIHSLSGEQDTRKLGRLSKVLPYTYSMLLVGSLALAGFPFLSGFFSKDLIIETSGSTYTISGSFSYWLGSLTACLTACYSFRVVYLIFIETSLSSTKYSYVHTPEVILKAVHEIPKSMGIALAILSLGSIFSGYFIKDAFVG
jgi:proton-translocating NADH-quinone oxidoreductase chain L